ncbi:hypothetical protein [Bdellovibrio sp. HCB2-146]|uniref:hypothetical protein n=1 Tax=Bdellovibrio sp. HCB2-146 TaxID=3394362 RepID=UPI0039BCFF5D
MKKIFFLLPAVFVCMSALASGDGPSNNSHRIEKAIKNGQATIQSPTCHVSSFFNMISAGYTNDFIHSGRNSRDWTNQSRFGSLLQAQVTPVTEENSNQSTFDKIIRQRLEKNGFKFDERTSNVFMRDGDDVNSLEIVLTVDKDVETYNGLGDSFTKSYYSVVIARQIKNGKVEDVYSYGTRSKVFKKSIFIPTTNKAIASHFDAVVEAVLSNLPSCKQK